MPTTQDAPTQTRISKKVVISVLIVFAFFSGLIFYLVRYYKTAGQLVYRVVSSSQNEAIDLIQLEKDYKENFVIIIQKYLTDSDLNFEVINEDFLVRTQEAQQQLLDLKVPVALKDYHLSAVLALLEIEKGINEQDLESIADNIFVLEEILANF